MTNKQYLNIGTAIYEENKKNGIMICGINWGGEVDPKYDWNSDMIGASFFSDYAHNNQKDKDPNRFNNSVVRWFKELGHPLATTKEEIGPFEKSIFNTNWLRNQSPDMDGIDTESECIANPGNFDYHVERFKPKIIVFLSVTLFDALNSPKCATRTRDFFGSVVQQSFWGSKDKILPGTEGFDKKFRVRTQLFDKVSIVALPHPTPTKGPHPSPEYIKAYRSVLSPIFEKFKIDRGFDK